MKIWNSYSSEHSANLVMIGRFKDVASAEAAKDVIDEICQFIADSSDDYEGADRYSDGVMELLQKVTFYSVAPSEIEQFRYDVRSAVDGTEVVIKTNESDISAYFKLLVDRGARVEVFTADDEED